MHPVYIRSAELGEPFTDKPRAPLRELMLRAGERAIAEAHLHPREVDALFVAAMGSFPHEQFLGALPLWLANRLGLRNADVSPMLIGSSESGAWALRRAFESLRRSDEFKHALIIAGEQMNPLIEQRAHTDTAKAAERLARNQTIAQVVDEADRRYGLNMLRMSDLLMDTIAHVHDLSIDDLRNLILPFVSLEKYRRVRRYPFGQFSRNQLEVLEQYHRRPSVTYYFRLDDVTPTSTGAVAVVLSRQPDNPDRPVRIRGMGQGFVDASMARRRGDPAVVHSIRDAFARACRDAGTTREWLLDCDFAVIHDAFPSIEYFFLYELGLAPSDIVRRMVSGWSNPFGGLKGCGHALGASGLLQVAKSYHAFTQNPHYIHGSAPPSPYPELVRSPPYQSCFTTSVGGVLANILVTLIDTETTPVRSRARVERKDTLEGLEPPTLRGPGIGVVLASTNLEHTPTFGDDHVDLFRHHVHEPWIYLLAVDPDDELFDKTFAYSEQRYKTGDVVRFSELELEGHTYVRVDELLGSEPFCSVPMSEARVAFLLELERRFQSHRPHPVQMLDTIREIGNYLCYAISEERSFVLRYKARRQVPGGIGLGHPVSVRSLSEDVDDAMRESIVRGWERRVRCEHPSLVPVLEHLVLEDGEHALVTHHHEGTILPHVLRPNHRIPFDQFLLWSRDLASALAELYRTGLSHGQLEPEQVLVTPQKRVVLLDPWLDGTGIDGVDVQHDLRSLGVILHMLYTGDRPSWLDVDMVDLGPAVAVGHPTVVRLLARLLGRDARHPFGDLDEVCRELERLRFQRDLEIQETEA